MASDVSIVNIALRRIGEEGLESLVGETKMQVVCAEIFPICLDEMLERHPWSFALKRQLISSHADAPVFGYDYKYTLPYDYIGAVEINEDKDSIYRIESGYIMMDSDECQLLYVSRITDMNLLTPGAVAALANLLAAKLSYNLAGGKQKALELEQQYEIALQLAFNNDRANNVGVSESDEIGIGVGSWETREA